jgi:hypothetical protein
MAATNNLPKYGTAAQITCGIASLASGSTRESAVQSNTATSGQGFDVLVTVTFSLASGSPSTSSPVINFYANGSVDNTVWPRIQLSSAAPFQTGGGDASVGALGTPSNARMIGSYAIQTTTTNGERTFGTEPMSVGNGFAGTIPPFWSLMVENQTGVAFSTSGTATNANYVDAVTVFSSSGN